MVNFQLQCFWSLEYVTKKHAYWLWIVNWYQISRIYRILSPGIANIPKFSASIASREFLENNPWTLFVLPFFSFFSHLKNWDSIMNHGFSIDFFQFPIQKRGFLCFPVEHLLPPCDPPQGWAQWFGVWKNPSHCHGHTHQGVGFCSEFLGMWYPWYRGINYNHIQYTRLKYKNMKWTAKKYTRIR